MVDLYIDLQKIRENAVFLADTCRNKGIELVGVVKACPGSPDINNAILESGIKTLAWSRMGSVHAGAHSMLLRQPTSQNAAAAVRSYDCLLISSAAIAGQISSEAVRQDKDVDLIMMIETGDAREGFLVDEVREASLIIEKLPKVRLLGTGTNVACLEGLPTTTENVSILLSATKTIENAIGRPIEVVSGGNSSAWLLLSEGRLPEKINQLRFGEALLLGRETTRKEAIKGCHQDTFSLSADILEVRIKTVSNERKRLQAVLAVGYADFGSGELTPIEPFVKIQKSSSDHLVVELLESDVVSEGDRLSFMPDYRALVALMQAQDVRRIYVNRENSAS